jgi:glycosyltransferase involved in cell wall biosynthesis
VRVLLVGRLPSEGIGGVPSYTALLAQTLATRGCEVAVLHPARSGSPPSSSFLPLPARPVGLLPGRRVRAYGEAFAVRAAARAAIERFRPDVVHLQYGGSMDLLLVAPLSRAGAPLLVTAHCGPAWRHLAVAPRAAVRRLLPADLLLCLGEAQARFFARAGFPEERLRVAGTAIEEAFLAPLARGEETSRPRGLYLGRIAPEKGLETLLEALRRLAPEDRPAFDLVGPGERRHISRLLARAERLGLLGQVRIGAPVRSVAERIALLDAADLYVHPSRVDATPLAVLEAMARARPVVASALPGTVEVLDGAGLLFPPGDAQALAEAILSLLCDPGERSRLGAAARARAAPHTPGRLAGACLDLYREAEERRACASRT